MRSSTKSAVAIFSMGVLGASWYVGQSATAKVNGSFAAPTTENTATTDIGNTSAGSESTNPGTTTDTNASTGSSGSTSSSGSSPSSGATSPAPSPSASASTPASNTGSSSGSVTKDGSSVESGFGPVQVQVTMSNGKITTITMLQAMATHGRAAAFPYLIQYAIAANGSNFANISGATFTANAFKRSLDAALAKF